MHSQMALCIATREWPGWMECVKSWDDTGGDINHYKYVIANTDVLTAYQLCYKQSTEPILAFIHDDVVIYERSWDCRVLDEFDDPSVGVVGFGGALGHATPDLYDSPYRIPNLARQHFISNMRSAETHGHRFTGERDVAILDGMALFVRRSILDKVGGWPIDKPVGYWLYAEWLCCEARRQGFRIRVVGVDFEHLGGKSSGYIPSSPTYEEAHRYLYDANRDVLPYRVPE